MPLTPPWSPLQQDPSQAVNDGLKRFMQENPYPSPPLSVTASPLLPQTSFTMPTIETTLNRGPNTIQLQEIPPFNPHSRKRKQEEQPPSSHQGSAQKQSRPTSAYASTTVSPPFNYTPEPKSTSSRATATTSQKNAYRSSQSAALGPNTNLNVSGIGITSPNPNGTHHHSSTGGKPRIFFGPYQLLQTLGEGEFGKVKLGVRGDARWGEEVAIKLIKRGSVQDSQQRMTKVMREIEVLKIVKHPNIVRLHDVIDTEKYIGIVLEYASGESSCGELFDHILAHRYLKDRDASKLFAQLISGVAYLHAKKIVHRDLKLENLLLDRNRNIIITDFGFANRFHDKRDDLMATSCGSPCYAAPELVVQDGKYVGKAVDVWSCGVILYAMLAGYLPFDDDPANPDSENINLLYKYIISTPLSFPDWITFECRDLLLRMLVPDPTKRCTLTDVAGHSWLMRYSKLFELTVDDLEQQAADQDEQKHRMLERRKEAILHPEHFQQQHMTRSQSSQVANRHQSAVVSSSTMQQIYAPPLSNSVAQRPTLMTQATSTASDKRKAHAQSAIILPSGMATVASASSDIATADPFSYGNQPVSLESQPMAISASAPSRPPTDQSSMIISHPPSHRASSIETDRKAAEEELARKRKAQAHRYTVQVEYDSSTIASVQPTKIPSRSSSKSSAAKKDTPASPVLAPPVHTQYVHQHSDNDQSGSLSSVGPRSYSKSSSQDSPTESESMASSARSEHGHSTPRASRHSIVIPAAGAVAALASGEVTPTVKTSREPESNSTTLRQAETGSLPFPTPERIKASAPESPRKVGTPTGERRQTKGSAADRFSFARLLGSSTTSIDKLGTSEDTTTALDESTNRKKTSRRKALSMVVEPFKASSTQKAKRQSVRVTTSNAEAEKPQTRASTLQDAAVVNTTTNLPTPASPRRSPRKDSAVSAAQTVALSDASWSTNTAVPGKAKRVMDWFRWKSMPRDSSLSDIAAQPTSVDTDFDRPKTRQQLRNSVIVQSKLQEQKLSAPQVVVSPISEGQSTVDIDSQPSSRSASGSASIESASTPAIALPSTAAQSKRHSVAHSLLQREASVSSQRTVPVNREKELAFYEARLRYHSGAVDQNALTSGKPIVVLGDLRKVLWTLGCEIREETSPFRLKCTRHSSKKVAAMYGLPLTAVFPTSTEQQAQSRPDSQSGVPMSASLSSSGMSSSTSFRNFFVRRGSSTSPQVLQGNNALPSPALSLQTNSSEAPDMLLSPLNRSTSSVSNIGQPLPFFGKDEPGAEVRFTVEISRLKGLPDLYAIDIRRLKGNLWSYRAIYKEVIQKLELSV